MCRDLKIENDLIRRIASCFGGGMGNTGSVCGAVVGAMMAIGIKMDRGESIEDWFRIASVVQEFRRRFESEMETISCRELIGIDLTSEEGREELMKSDNVQMVCISAVANAYRLVTELLKENS